MLFGQKNIESINQLVEEVKLYISLQKRFVELDATEKISVLFSALFIWAVMLLLGTIVIFFACTVLALYLSKVWGNIILGFGVVTAVLSVIGVLVYVFRQQLIIAPTTRFVAKLLLQKDTNNGHHAE